MKKVTVAVMCVASMLIGSLGAVAVNVYKEQRELELEEQAYQSANPREPLGWQTVEGRRKAAEESRAKGLDVPECWVEKGGMCND